jgi:hypothetical protein
MDQKKEREIEKILTHRSHLQISPILLVGSPAVLGSFGSIERAKEARTRGFASPALAGFAFIATHIVRQWGTASILGCT